jgi:membrane protein DedA with SNARE-associated domain
MINFVQNVIESIGYVGVGLLVFLENVFPPIPSEVVIPFAGFTARQGDYTLWGMILAGTIGSVAGALPLYYLGYYLSEARVMRLADKYGAWLTVSGEDIQRADAWLRERGQVAVFICRLIPGLRSIISIPAGIAEMPLLPFLFWTTLGTGLWTALLAVAGYLLRQGYQQILPYIDRAGWIAFAVLFIAFGVWVYRRRQSDDTDETGRVSDTAS